MATSPPPDDQAKGAREALIALYRGIQVTLTAGIMTILADMTPTEFGRAAALRKMKAFTRQVATSVVHRRGPLVTDLIEKETQAGQVEALRQIDGMVARGRLPRASTSPTEPRRVLSGAPPARPLSTPDAMPGDRPTSTGSTRGDLSIPHGVRAEAEIRTELTHELQAAEERITRLPDDVFKEVASDAAIQNVIGSGITPHEAMAKAWHDFMGQGITGFTDRAGRKWNLATYTEMAVRTASARAYNAATIEQLRIEGISLFTVPPHNDPCPLCTPWENAILSYTPSPWADGTVAEAQAAGLFHPNCRHALVGWMPGLSPRLPRHNWNETRQEKYEATQKQRAIERDIRRAKVQYDYALSTIQKRDAAIRIRELQARLRRHLHGHANLTRESYREQRDLGLSRGK